MSSDHISRRNRANAKKSTGPKTRKGKAKVAENARKHGATAQPDPASVATWLAIILDQPQLTPSNLMPQDDAGYRALALAQADARLVAAEKALCDFEQNHLSVSSLHELAFDDFIQEVLPSAIFERPNDGPMLGILKSMHRLKLSQMAQEKRERHRLLKRYLAEARSKRGKAFAAWLEIRQREAAEV